MIALSNEQARAVLHGTGYHSFSWVDLPVGPQPFNEVWKR